MSVSDEITLPSRDNYAVCVYEPLGGNGTVAPFAAYYINNFEVTGDATGGTAQLEINCDPRYSCLLSFVNTIASGGTISAAVGCRISIKYQSTFEYAIHATGSYGGLEDAVSRVHFSPDPLFDMQRVRLRWANVDAAAFKLDCVMYLFKKNVQQQIPMPTLLSNLPRNAATIP